jgi:hypothetical protein
MWTYLRKLLMGAPRPQQVWTVEINNVWHKVVSSEKPNTILPQYCMGPWRSEVDAEEFCDRTNTKWANQVAFYTPE